MEGGQVLASPNLDISWAARATAFFGWSWQVLQLSDQPLE
jgi:hypothetical protein